MKVYVDKNDIKRNIITYCNGTNTQQGLYVFGKDKIEVLSLADYTKQVRKEVLDIIDKKFNCCGYVEEKFEDIKEYVLDQLQGESKCLN